MPTACSCGTSCKKTTARRRKTTKKNLKTNKRKKKQMKHLLQHERNFLRETFQPVFVLVHDRRVSYTRALPAFQIELM